MGNSPEQCRGELISLCEKSMFSTKQLIIQETGFSASSLKRFRLSGVWIEGIHWVRVGSRKTLYNRELILDWLVNQCNPEAHQKAIEIYLSRLPSNQPMKRGRKAS
jgi:hypothetical protein